MLSNALSSAVAEPWRPCCGGGGPFAGRRRSGCLQNNACTPHTHAHELSLAIKAVTTVGRVVAFMYVVGMAHMMSNMAMPESATKHLSGQLRQRSHRKTASCSQLPCERMKEIHMHVNHIVRVRTCTTKMRLPTRLNTSD